jgi:hypothetical protein
MSKATTKHRIVRRLKVAVPAPVRDFPENNVGERTDTANLGVATLPWELRAAICSYNNEQ